MRFRLGTNPGTNVDLVLATNSEWTMVTSVNCTREFGCDRSAFDARKSESEVIDWQPRIQVINVRILKDSNFDRLEDNIL